MSPDQARRRPRWRRKRVWIPSLLVLLLAAAPFVAYGWATWPRPEDPSARGRLSCAVADQSLELGDFRLIIEREPAQLRIVHKDAPERVLWANVPGESFLAFGRGRVEIADAHASFELRDALEGYSAELELTGLTRRGGALVLSLEADGRACEFGLRPLSSRRLSFSLELPDQDKTNRIVMRFARGIDEEAYGFGTQYSRVDLAGRRFPILSQEQGIGRGAQPITTAVELIAGSGGRWYSSYAPAPFFFGGRVRGLVLENREVTDWDLRVPGVVRVKVYNDDRCGETALRGQIIYGREPLDVIEAYSEVCGRMPPLPDWVHKGVIVGMQGGSARVRAQRAVFEEAGVPLAGFWLQDWVGKRRTRFGSQLWWNWESDDAAYPDWPELVAELDRGGIATLGYVNPFLVDASEKGGLRRDLFKEAKEKGFLVKRAGGELAMIPITTFDAALVDLTNPKAFEWLKAVIRDQLLKTGVKGWMADFGEALPFDAELASGASPAVAHNRFPEEWARLNREVLREAGAEGEALFFCRSGFTGSPGSATLFWLGDQMVSWDEHDGIKTAVRGLISSGLSGFSLNHSDIGGYTSVTTPLLTVHRSRELLMRWLELNAFTAVFRSHEGNEPGENPQLSSDPETLAQLARCARVYAALAPYRKRLCEEASARAWPLVRHLFLHYPGDPEARRQELQFLLGRDILVAPVLDPGRERVRVYLPPSDRWIGAWDGADAGAGFREVAAPLGRPAVFVRAGASGSAELQRRLAAALAGGG